MTDRGYVVKAADAGVQKVSLLQEDPFRYMLRAVCAGMGLTLVVFVFWVLKQNLHDISIGPVIASGFFGVGLMIIVFTNTGCTGSATLQGGSCEDPGPAPYRLHLRLSRLRTFHCQHGNVLDGDSRWRYSEPGRGTA